MFSHPTNVVHLSILTIDSANRVIRVKIEGYLELVQSTSKGGMADSLLGGVHDILQLAFSITDIFSESIV
jgi:hypothetical protein